MNVAGKDSFFHAYIVAHAQARQFFELLRGHFPAAVGVEELEGPLH